MSSAIKGGYSPRPFFYSGLAERGGATSNRGEATVYAALDGSPLQSLGGDGHVDGEHARFAPPAEGHLAITAEQHRGDGFVRIVRWNPDGSSQEIATPPAGDASPLGAACDAAWAKASCYHCRSAHYSLPPRGGRP